jgi:hypothetical protein
MASTWAGRRQLQPIGCFSHRPVPVTAPVAAPLSKRASDDLDGIALDAAKKAKRLEIAFRVAEFDAQQAARNAGRKQRRLPGELKAKRYLLRILSPNGSFGYYCLRAAVFFTYFLPNYRFYLIVGVGAGVGGRGCVESAWCMM